MTKEEALQKIKELEDYVKELDDEIGFEDDDLFLLSIEEYEKYKDVIPNINCRWWLRSSGDSNKIAAYIREDNSISYFGNLVIFNDGVRPAFQLKIKYYKRELGKRYMHKGFPFICIDVEKGLFIAEVPIGFHRFDEKSSNYQNSEIRQWLKDWVKSRDLE